MREGVQELYSYREGTTLEDRELDLLAEVVISLAVEETMYPLHISLAV